MILSLIGFRQDQGTIFDVYEDICTTPDVLSNRSSSHNFQILWWVQSKKKTEPWKSSTIIVSRNLQHFGSLANNSNPNTIEQHDLKKEVALCLPTPSFKKSKAFASIKALDSALRPGRHGLLLWLLIWLRPAGSCDDFLVSAQFPPKEHVAK